MADAKLTLSVLLEDRLIGSLEQSAAQGRQFSYIDDWESIATPLSMSMQPRQAPYSHKVVDPYLWGLVPDNQATRRQIGRQFEVSPNNPMALLSKIGLDCAGAVRFCIPKLVPEILQNHGALIPLTEREIAERLQSLNKNSLGIQLSEEESWSLAGNQSKTALRLQGGQWFMATGAQPTTHILKPGILMLKDQALNEYICISVAERIGLRASKVSYLEFEGEPAICIERYDRMRTEDDRVMRLHQEDLCQALSVNPDNKYSSDGGPTADIILDLLSKVGRSDLRNNNREDFAKALFFNYLMMAPDGHAKNFSLLLLSDLVRLAPLYDIASGVPYTNDSGELRYKRTAMRIGGENRFGSLTGAHIRKFAKRNSFEESWAMESFRNMAERIPGTLEAVFDEANAFADCLPLRDAMMGPLSSHCRKAVRRL